MLQLNTKVMPEIIMGVSSVFSATTSQMCYTDQDVTQ